MKKLIVIFLLLVLSLAGYAANEVICPGVPGLSYCFVIVRNADFYRWNTNTTAFAASVAKAYQGTNFTEGTVGNKGLFYGTFPATISAGEYTLIFYDTTAAAHDPNNTSIGYDDFSWSGSAEITNYTIYTQLALIDVDVGLVLEDTNELQQALAGLVSDINDIKAQVSDPNDNTTIAGRIADLWLTSSGGFP